MTAKLYYYDFRGRAELVRLSMALGGMQYEDVRFSNDDWPKYKPDSPFGQVPYIEYQGKKYGQSVAIANYVARECGLYGKTNVDALVIDQVMGIGQDIWSAIIKVFSESDETKKAELDKKLMSEDFPRLFGCFDKLLRESGGDGVFVGKDLTLADICVYDMMYSMNKVKKYDAGAAFAALKTLREKVEANPKIKAYLASRKETDF